jgi:hypothetical protein
MPVRIICRSWLSLFDYRDWLRLAYPFEQTLGLRGEQNWIDNRRTQGLSAEWTPALCERIVQMCDS